VEIVNVAGTALISTKEGDGLLCFLAAFELNLKELVQQDIIKLRVIKREMRGDSGEAQK
jgi:hypothetical protein